MSMGAFLFGGSSHGNTENFKRRLTGILSADVEGYSCLMRDNEDESRKAVKG